VFDPTTLLQLRKDAKKARRSQGLTQEELEAKTGVPQSQVSLIEKCERPLSEGAIRQLCALCQELGLEIPDVSGAAPPPAGSAIAFCPDPWCPGAVIRTIPQHVLIKPAFVERDSEAASNCEICGEVVVRECRQCRCPVEVAVCCRKCGQNYVDVPDDWRALGADQLRQIEISNRQFSAELSKDKARFG
jgi:transcriptional regulator with XRE-family HTH domain